jgi:L-seryl-tRNA(Ser) seleniumtransferase
MPSFRVIPSVDDLLQRAALAAALDRHGRPVVAGAVREAAADLRARIERGGAGLPASTDEAAAWIEQRALDDVRGRLTPSLRRVINATGVILHTNLGRAPLAAEALANAAVVSGGYANLEYDLAAGARGHRHAHADALLRLLTGAEAALVANNNAAAVLLVLAALAAGREVIVSRGELVEIGGGFRVPDVLAQSGARLREVGTTNRTRLADYAAAIGPDTAVLLRVHPSNFTISGFTERPSLDELASLARRFELPLVEDLGSGWLGFDAADVPALASEPSVAASLRAGVDLVAFSGDKLLGGPQAGIVVGRRALVERAGRHPLMRAVRADKLTYAVLEATLALWTSAASRARVPAYAMIAMTAGAVAARATRLCERLAHVPQLVLQVVEGASTIGGGSSPGSALPTTLVAASVEGLPASSLEARLRAGDPPVIARIAGDRVLIDLRTVLEQDDAVVASALEAAARGGTPAG